MFLKQLSLRLAHLAGVNAAVRASAWRRARVPIFGFHGVARRDEYLANPSLYLSPARLRARLEQVRAGGYRVLALAAALARLRAGTLPPRSVVLTFDDGLGDFAEVAVPLLAEFGYAATVYVATYYCERPLPVFDPALYYLLWRGRASGADVADLAGARRPLPLDTPAARDAAWQAVYGAAARRGLDADGKHALLACVAGRVGVDWAAFLASGMYQQMTPAHFRALPRDLVDVQLHTHRHRLPRAAAAFAGELRDNRAALARLAGDGPRAHFCYPSGEYQPEFPAWLRAAGVASAATCVPGLAGPESDPLLLPRVVVTQQTSAAQFEAWLSGAAAFLPRRRAHRFDPARAAPAGVRRVGLTPAGVRTPSSSSGAGSPSGRTVPASSCS